jgi:hypothetical protein
MALWQVFALYFLLLTLHVYLAKLLAFVLQRFVAWNLGDDSFIALSMLI